WGHIGFDHSTYSAIPVQVDFAGSFKDISAGYRHVCGLDTSDKIWCWGDGSTGALGIGPSGKLLKPTTSVAGTYKSVSAGNAYTCAVSTTGQGYCWGMNYYGRFGDGTQTHSNVPVPVLGGPYLKINVDNSYHTTAIKAP
ncbi:MAG: hypothetical protein GX568_01210, partial [Candidatus Gastranaerophilales bacterium]|nr:hypothetical protein [Candidatus Gastranaerophilales bacterium]